MGSERTTAARMSPRARRRRNGQRDGTEYETEGSEPTAPTDAADAAGAMLDMQRAVGNRAVTRSLQSMGAVGAATVSREMAASSSGTSVSASPYGALDDQYFNADNIAHDLLRAINQEEHTYVPDQNYQSNVALERRKVNVPKVIEVLENKTATQIAEIERRYFDFEKQTTLRDDLFGGGQSGRQSSMTADQRERITALLKGTKGEPIPARVLEDLKKYPPAVAGPIRAALQEKSDAAAALNQLEADAGELHELFADKLDGAQLERVMAMHRRPGKEIDALDAFYDHHFGVGQLYVDMNKRLGLDGLKRMRMTELRLGNWAQADACAIEEKRRAIDALNAQDKAESGEGDADAGLLDTMFSGVVSVSKSAGGYMVLGNANYLRDQRQKQRLELTGGINAIIDMNKREALDDKENKDKSAGAAVAERLDKLLGPQDGELGHTLGSELTKTLGKEHSTVINAAADSWNAVGSSNLVESAAAELVAMEADDTTKAVKMMATMRSFRELAKHDLRAMVQNPYLPPEEKKAIGADLDSAVTGLAQKYVDRYRDAYDRQRGKGRPFQKIVASADEADTTLMKDMLGHGGTASEVGELQHAMAKEDINHVKEILHKLPNREAVDKLVGQYNSLGDGRDLRKELFGTNIFGDQVSEGAAAAAEKRKQTHGLMTGRDAAQVAEQLVKPTADQLAGRAPPGTFNVPLAPGTEEVSWTTAGGALEYDVTMMHKGTTGSLRELGDVPETQRLLKASNDKLPKLAERWAAETDPAEKHHLLLEIRKTRATLSGDADAYEKDNERVLGEIRGALTFAVSIALAIAIPGAGAGLVAFLETAAINIAANIAANVVIKNGDYGWADLEGDLLGGALGAGGAKFGEALLGRVALKIIGPAAKATIGATEKAGISVALGKEASNLATAGEKAVIGAEEFEAKAAGREAAAVVTKEGEAAVATGVGKEAAVAGDVVGAEGGAAAKEVVKRSLFETAMREAGGFFGTAYGAKLPSGDMNLSVEDFFKALFVTLVAKAAHHQPAAGAANEGPVPGESTTAGQTPSEHDASTNSGSGSSPSETATGGPGEAAKTIPGMGRAGGSEVTPGTGSQPVSKTIPGMGSFGGSEGRPASGRSRGSETILGMGEPSFREVLADLNAEVNRRVQDVQALEELRIADPNNPALQNEPAIRANFEQAYRDLLEAQGLDPDAPVRRARAGAGDGKNPPPAAESFMAPSIAGGPANEPVVPVGPANEPVVPVGSERTLPAPEGRAVEPDPANPTRGETPAGDLGPSDEAFRDMRAEVNRQAQELQALLEVRKANPNDARLADEPALQATFERTYQDLFYAIALRARRPR